MLEILKQKFDYLHDGLYYKSGKRAGTLRKEGYRYIKITYNNITKAYAEHRLCFYYMNGRWPTEIDHIDRNKSNNAWNNLREVTRQENLRNRDCKGIHWDKDANKYRAQIQIDGKKTYLGIFSDYNQALHARQQAELQFWR